MEKINKKIKKSLAIQKIILIVLLIILVMLLSFIPYRFFKEVEKQETKKEVVKVLPDLIIQDNVNINDIVNAKYKEKFNTKIKEISNLKYPAYITDILLSENTLKTYSTKDLYLEIGFYNETINYGFSYNLKVYYNEIKDYLNYKTVEYLDYTNESAYDIDLTKKQVAITFDDGPHSEHTPRLLNVLENNKVHATFFMLGLEMDKYKDIIKQVDSHGHEIGLHAYSHTSFKTMSLESTKNELDRTNQILFEVTGKYSNIVRPPYGSLTDRVINELGYSYILWDIDTNDWRYKNPNDLVDHVINNVEEGSIILFHDIFSTSVDAIEILLPRLYSMGYQVVDVSTLSQAQNIPLQTNVVYRYLR